MKLKELLSRENGRYTAKEIFSWLWQAWRGNRLQAILNAVIGLLFVVVSLSQVWAVQRAIDIAAGNISGSIYWAVGVMGCLILCNFALNISSIWVSNLLGIKAQNHMQQQLLDRILRSEWSGKDGRHSGDVLNRLEKDVITVINFLTEVIPNMLSVLAMFLGAFCYLFFMDKILAVITVVIIPIFIVISKYYVRSMRKLTRTVRESDSKVQSVLQETVQNRVLIKALEDNSMMVSKLEDTQSQLRQNVVKRTMFRVLSNFILNFGFALGYLIAFLWAALRMAEHSLTFGGMTAFLQLVNRIQTPARNLTKLVPAFVNVFTAAERLMELEENPLEEEGVSIYMNAPCGVRLSGVTFAYDNAEGKVLDNLSFDFKPGTCTAVIGETGTGKTTLIRLILSLLRQQDGTMEIYNHKTSHKLSPRTRCNFLYVPQGNTLMSGTIRENLRLGNLEATDEEMIEALHKSCADFVMELPQGLDSRCGEGGDGLSEGQSQRICIARALLRNRHIMLFDEATSSLDPDTESQLLQNILSSHDKTVIFITHRMEVIRYCDFTLKIGK
jgi:ATP-binding cassette subfamily B protein